MPGSESGELMVSGGLALEELTERRKGGGGGLTGALAAIAPLLTLREDKANASLRETFLGELPAHVRTFLPGR